MASQPLPAGHDGAGATAAPRVFPYRDHRTMAEVLHQERQADNASWAWGDDFEERVHGRRMKAGSDRLLRALLAATPAAGNQLSQPPAVSARPDLGHNPSRNDAEGLGSSHVPHGITTSAEGQRHHGL